MTAFVLDAMPVNTVFQNALSIGIAVEHPKLLSEGCDFVSWMILWSAIAWSRSLLLRHRWSYLSARLCTPTCSKDYPRLKFSPTHAIFSLACLFPDKSPIEHVWDLVCQRLARDLRPSASKDELFLPMQGIWNSLPQADIQNLFNSMPCRIAALIAACGGYTKCWFRTLILFYFIFF